jgi:general stress protein 26
MGQNKQAGTLDELYKLLDDFDTVMLVTVTQTGQLHARPMQLQERSKIPDCDLWFVTAADTAKVGDINWDHEVNVCCLRSSDKAYLSIAGYAEIDTDPSLIQKVYQQEWKIWMGDDAAQSAAIIRLTIERAEYWEPEGGRARILYEMLKGAVTGEAASKKLNPPKEI